MHRIDSSSLAHILASPWQRWHNEGRFWGPGIVIALCAVAPVGMGVWSLFCDPRLAEGVRHGAVVSGWAGLGALVLAAWAILVGDVLRQNRLSLARLVPGHVGRLRAALLAAWAVLVLVATAGPGFALDAPLAWACCVAGGLALLTAALRWPWLWTFGIAAPFVVHRLITRPDADALGAALQANWARESWLLAAVVATAGALVLVVIVRTGEHRHFAARAHGLSARPYDWWLNHVLARGDSTVGTRLLLGLGPATHWAAHLRDAFWFFVIGGGLCAVVALLVGSDLGLIILAWMGFSVVTGVASPALQAVPRLVRTRREQALLALLPGVPRGARLNRWLAWQMSLSLLCAIAGALLLFWGINAVADLIEPGLVDRATGGMGAACAAALPPQLVWQWRAWARMPSSRGLQEALPALAQVGLGAVFLTLHHVVGATYLAMGVALTAASLMYCAWRWWRMGAERSALPVGRLG